MSYAQLGHSYNLVALLIKGGTQVAAAGCSIFKFRSTMTSCIHLDDNLRLRLLIFSVFV